MCWRAGKHSPALHGVLDEHKATEKKVAALHKEASDHKKEIAELKKAIADLRKETGELRKENAALKKPQVCLWLSGPLPRRWPLISLSTGIALCAPPTSHSPTRADMHSDARRHSHARKRSPPSLPACAPSASACLPVSLTLCVLGCAGVL